MTQNDASLDVQAVATIGGVVTDLVDIVERLPVPAEQSEVTARLLDRLADEIREAAGMLRGFDPAVARMLADPRVARTRQLLAEHHQPLSMSPGDVRQLLARFQRAMTELLDVLGPWTGVPVTAVDDGSLRGTVNGLTAAVTGLAAGLDRQIGLIEHLDYRVNRLNREVNSELAGLVAELQQQWYLEPPEPRRRLKLVRGVREQPGSGPRCASASSPASAHPRRRPRHRHLNHLTQALE